MTDEDAFESAIDEQAGQIRQPPRETSDDPNFWLHLASLRLVYADWLEERGDPCAAAQRWLAESQKLPRDSGQSWDWWCYGDRPETKPEDLPGRIWDHLPGRPRKDMANCKEYSTRRAAERALFKALSAIEAVG